MTEQADVDKLFNKLYVDGRDEPFQPSDIPNNKLTTEDRKIGKSCNAVFRVKISDLIKGGPAKELAMKAIEDKNTTDEHLYKQEITILNKARNCDEIVKFFGAAHIDKYYYIFMELMTMDLAKFLAYVPRKSKKGDDAFIQDEDLLAHIAISMTTGLNFLTNALNTVHSDIKPANVLINDDGHVKIADLGIAKIIPPERTDQSYVSKGHGITFHYAAPERVAGGVTGSYRRRADVWSMGMTLHEVATGRYFYGNITKEEISSVIRDKDAPVISKAESGFTLQMCTFINSCLVKDVRMRNNIKQMSEMLLCQNKGKPEERENGTGKMSQAVKSVVEKIVAEKQAEKKRIPTRSFALNFN